MATSAACDVVIGAGSYPGSRKPNSGVRSLISSSTNVTTANATPAEPARPSHAADHWPPHRSIGASNVAARTVAADDRGRREHLLVEARLADDERRPVQPGRRAGTYHHPESGARGKKGGVQDPQGCYGEETLDFEAVHSMAPGANIVYSVPRTTTRTSTLP